MYPDKENKNNVVQSSLKISLDSKKLQQRESISFSNLNVWTSI